MDDFKNSFRRWVVLRSETCDETLWTVHERSGTELAEPHEGACETLGSPVLVGTVALAESM